MGLTALRIIEDNRNGMKLIAALSYVLLASFYIVFSWEHTVAGFLSDDAVYLLLADIYSPWVNVNEPVYTYLLDHNRFPPVYPLLLGLSGVDSDNIQLAGRINSFLLVISFLVIGIWYWRETGAVTVAVCLALAFALLPATLIFSQEVWSEFLYLLLSYIALLFLANTELKTTRTWLLIGLIISLATLTRTAGLSLLFTYLVLLIINKPRNSKLLLIASALPFVCWNLLNTLTNSGQGYVSEIIEQAQYVSILDLHRILLEWCFGFWQSWCWLFTLQRGGEISFIQSLLAGFCLFLASVGFLVRIRKKTADAVYLLIYLLVLFIWPYDSDHFNTRFQYPVIPIYLLCMWQTAVSFGTNRFRLRFISCALAAAILLLITPADISIISRAYADIDDELKAYSRTREWMLSSSETQGLRTIRNMRHTIESLRQLQHKIPAQECVYAIQAPLVMLHAKRITGVLPVPEIDQKNFIEQTGTCRFMLATNMIDHRNNFPRFYPLDRIAGMDNYIIHTYAAENSNNPEVNMYLIERKFIE